MRTVSTSGPSIPIFQVFLFQVLFGLTEASRLFVMSGDTILEQPETCQDSAECPLDFCCRGRQGNIVDSSGTFDVIGNNTLIVVLLLIMMLMFM